MEKYDRARELSRRSVRRFALALALGCVPAAAGAEEAPEGADDCVSFENRLGDKRVTVHVQNSCDVRLSCTLRYTVRCSASDGSQRSSSPKAASFKLDRRGKHELSLSAEACKQSWDIDEVRWECF